MAKRVNLTYVASETLVAFAQDAGFPILVQKGFTKISGPQGARIYVSNCKSCARVDLSDFVVEDPGVVNLGEASFGGVTQQLDFARPEADILATFIVCLDALATAPKAAPKPKKARASQAAPMVMDVSARAALIKKVAEEKGLEIAASTLDSIAASEATL